MDCWFTLGLVGHYHKVPAVRVWLSSWFFLLVRIQNSLLVIPSRNYPKQNLQLSEDILTKILNSIRFHFDCHKIAVRIRMMLITGQKYSQKHNQWNRSSEIRQDLQEYSYISYTAALAKMEKIPVVGTEAGL